MVVAVFFFNHTPINFKLQYRVGCVYNLLRIPTYYNEQPAAKYYVEDVTFAGSNNNIFGNSHVPIIPLLIFQQQYVCNRNPCKDYAKTS